MSAKEKVLRAYPNAAAHQLKAVPGADGVLASDHWRIHPGVPDIVCTLGRGITEDHAWQDAATHLGGTARS